MLLTREEIQQPRTPSELKAFVDSVWERAKTDNELQMAGHYRSGYLKEFFDEIVPLSRFADAVYPADYRISPVLGNQGFDAEVRNAEGLFIERVEIANPVNGSSMAEAREELVRFGIGGLRIGNPGDDLEELIPIIERTVSKKSRKDYSDSAVVFNISACPVFDGFEDRYREQEKRIKGSLVAAGLIAKRVFVMLPTGNVEEIVV